MRSHNWMVLSAVLALSGVGSVSNVSAQEIQVGDSSTTNGVISINGKTVTGDDLTSFASQLESMEGRVYPTRRDLLEEYILTQLYDKVPTTATIVKGDEVVIDSQVPLANQRNLLKRELQRVVSTDVEVPRDLMEEWYSANSDRYMQPERVHAYHLFMETSEDEPSSAPASVRKRLGDIKKDIESGTSFSVAAKQHSEAASGQAGGEIGFIRRAQPIGPLSKPMNIELENAFFSLEPGLVSDILETRHGMHLLYLTDKETTRTPSLDDLISSGILPGVLTQDLVTSNLKTLISETIEKHNGKPSPQGEGEITSKTVAYQFDGKEVTFEELVSIYGPRFEGYFENIRNDPGKLSELKEQALEDEAHVQTALDKKLGESPEIKSHLEFMGTREKARKHLDALSKASQSIDENAVLQRYNEIKEQLRQPEADGTVIIFAPRQTSGTAEEARALEYTRRKAEEVHKRLQTEDFDAVVKDIVGTDGDVVTSIAKVTRFVVGQSTNTQARLFEQGITRIQGNTGIGEVVPFGSEFIISRLENRYPGEPTPLEMVRSRIESMVKSESEVDFRKKMVKDLEAAGLVKNLPGQKDYFALDEAGM